MLFFVIFLLRLVKRQVQDALRSNRLNKAQCVRANTPHCKVCLFPFVACLVDDELNKSKQLKVFSARQIMVLNNGLLLRRWHTQTHRNSLKNSSITSQTVFGQFHIIFYQLHIWLYRLDELSICQSILPFIQTHRAKKKVKVFK